MGLLRGSRAATPLHARSQLRVDWNACHAAGLCHELLPEVVSLDPWGYPVVEDGPLPVEQVRDARAAARACPRFALRVVEAPAG
ncbi:ferredoxin [Nocardioides bruguierae]|uniref:Ferredoxin n=1 Tax=Nocardioides bruguierae TaxID=2945102 RepID=A0A9X2IFW5_9ACTN|nr:ferredoxin [Nocardioides bruguierae]MCM0620170.1 ferredoxin [Nocardioides bruguierae]